MICSHGWKDANLHLINPAPLEKLSGQRPDISQTCVPFVKFCDIPTLESGDSSSADDSSDDDSMPKLLLPDGDPSSDSDSRDAFEKMKQNTKAASVGSFNPMK